jgi:hypothetical protein
VNDIIPTGRPPFDPADYHARTAERVAGWPTCSTRRPTPLTLPLGSRALFFLLIQLL